MADERQQKIALIGATGYEYSSPGVRVQCFRWDRLRKAANLADYDVLVLNLLSSGSRRELDAESIMELLSVQTMLEVLSKNSGGANGAIFVLGHPRFNVVEAPSEYHDHPNFKDTVRRRENLTNFVSAGRMGVPL